MGAAPRTSILPVTAAEMSAVRSSLRRSMASRTLATRVSIRAVSLEEGGDGALLRERRDADRYRHQVSALDSLGRAAGRHYLDSLPKR